MTPLLRAAAMREHEQGAMAAGIASATVLMERAGTAVVAATLAEWPRLARGPHTALVLAGPGNNGGDGFVIARLLAARGWVVTLALMPPPGRLPAAARHHQALLPPTVRQIRLEPDPAPMALDPLFAPAPQLIVDALFGTGLTRPLTALAPLVARVNMQTATPVVAVDFPSGICADSGRPLAGPDGAAPAIRADLTVTFHRARPGHYLGAGPDHCSRLVVADIGLPDSDPADQPALITAPDAAHLTKAATGHKYRHGHLLVLGGGSGQGGAARLAARAALRIGAGLVTVAVPPAAMMENAARLDAIMLRPLATATELADILTDPRISAICLGPGLGTTAAHRELLATVLVPQYHRPALIDADALTLLAQNPDLRSRLHPDCLLTPHMGEFARLCPDLAARLAKSPQHGPAFSRLDAVQAAAAELNATILLKGPDTVIASPDGQTAIHAAHYDRKAPWLATAGAGDVLAGIAAGLLARGLPPFAAASNAAWLHVEAARHFGPGLIAEDLPDILPIILRQLGA